MTPLSGTREAMGGSVVSESDRRSREQDNRLYRRACFQNTGQGWWNEGGSHRRSGRPAEETPSKQT